MRSSIPTGIPRSITSPAISGCTSGASDNPAQLFLQLGAPQQIAQRRAQIVQLFQCCSPRLALARNIKPSRGSIGYENLLVGGSVFPAHLSRLLDPEGSTLAAPNAAAGINFREISAQRFHTVVASIDFGRHLLVHAIFGAEPRAPERKSAAAGSIPAFNLFIVFYNLESFFGGQVPGCVSWGQPARYEGKQIGLGNLYAAPNQLIGIVLWIDRQPWRIIRRDQLLPTRRQMAVRLR